MQYEPNGPQQDTREDASSDDVRTRWADPIPPSTAIVEAVAAATHRDPTAMPPLYDTLDVEALDGLLTDERSAWAGNVAVSFTYLGAYVWVSSDGTIEIDVDGSAVE